MESFHFEAERERERLDAFLVRKTSQSREFIKSQISERRVTVNAVPAEKAGLRLRPGDAIAGSFVPLAAETVEARPGNLAVLYEDEFLLAVDKPQGLTVHPAPGVRGDTLVHYLLHHVGSSPAFTEISEERPGIVHRLDIGTSGVIVVAKSRKIQELLSRQFELREVKKTYEAIVWGRMDKVGRFDTPIGRHVTDRRKMGSHTKVPREAFTAWERVALVGPCFTHVRLFPRTGRTHQLRVHLSEGGFPIVGDKTYLRRDAAGLINKLGETARDAVRSLPHPCLHARRLEITHPVSGEPRVFEAPLPAAFTDLMGTLETGARDAADR